MDNEEMPQVDSTDLPEWLADLVAKGYAIEIPTCEDPDCNWPKDPETLAALCVATFVLTGDDEENQEAYRRGLVVHPESLAALADWAQDKLADVIGKAREWEASQPQD